ncbi:peptidylprolyl isomerase [Candidatus Pelagibacter sp.]|jgi:peptidyl-prolyl cis-trans isomerase SurA|nr:peptidylprolyl isomerase [Candidatus Pelagibacter sp.]
MKKKKLFYLLIIFYLFYGQANSLENKIILKVNDKIITTFDLKQEETYLMILNKNLNKIEKSKLNNLATDSIIKEKIKEIELNKYYQIDKVLDDANLKKIITNLYQTLEFQNEKEFINYLDTQNLNLMKVKKKLAIEMLWNNLIFQKFQNRVLIDEEEINNNLNKQIKDLSFSRDILLSEILIKNSKDLNLDLIYLKILKSIQDVGFAASANIFSASNTSKTGGKVGWVKETSLSKKILNNLINLKKGQISKPIKINENFLILKVDDIRINKQKIDKKELLNQKISYEKNQQLERYSLAYFNRVKQSVKINEF